MNERAVRSRLVAKAQGRGVAAVDRGRRTPARSVTGGRNASDPGCRPSSFLRLVTWTDLPVYGPRQPLARRAR